MKNSYKEIQEHEISKFDEKKLYSLDVEVINQPTLPLIHQTARFWYFKKGEGKISINNIVFNIHDNALVIIFPWDTTKIVEVTKPLHLVKIVFSIDFVNNFKITYTSDNIVSLPLLDSSIIQLDKKQVSEVEYIIQNIKDRIGIDSLFNNENNQSFNDSYVALKLNELYLLFLSYKNNTNQMLSVDNQNKKDDILKYIYSHVSSISLSQLSDVFYMSESAISKYITSQTGKSFLEIVKQIKISKTIDLLMHTDLTISEISQICGFSDDKHLINTFEKERSITPKKFRQLYQAESTIYKKKNSDLGLRAINYINSHFAENMNELLLTQKLNTSINKINTALLAITGMNFNNFLNYIRINKACVMLLKSNNSIIDIGESVGFHSTKTFTRYFYKYKEMTPSEFREKVYLQKGSESLPEYE